tara:strand:+ start:273 stop:536 length:264 start_codon:yes stop_codon:yes gene_type:complete
MDKKFLHKVLNQLVSETEIDDSEVVRFPFPPYSFPISILPPNHLSFFLSPSFPKHCRDIYGLNKDEIEYVWDNYREIVKDKIRNNGL